ncbi:hypothetical protein ES708_28618 [subsurface metagenome]
MVHNAVETERGVGSGNHAKTLADWLASRCREEKLSLRQFGARAKLSHATISAIIKGTRPSGATIVKLAAAFSADGSAQRGALVDYLLGLCGYRSERPGEFSEPIARLLDKMSRFSEPQLRVMERFADFLSETGGK